MKLRPATETLINDAIDATAQRTGRSHEELVMFAENSFRHYEYELLDIRADEARAAKKYGQEYADAIRVLGEASDAARDNLTPDECGPVDEHIKAQYVAYRLNQLAPLGDRP